jgi:HAD superfamily hydrolase (TIGR01549 family)
MTRRPRLLFFDVGETLVSEERMWGAWADWLKIPRLTFFAALGAVIAGRRHHEEVFAMLRPGIDLTAERAARGRAGEPLGFLASDLYPDTVAVLRRAKEAGFRLGFAGNHSQRTEAFVHAIGIEPDIVGSSERWGVAKPDLRFFQTIIDLSGLDPGEIVYVGDRIDNDVLPALRAGLQAVFIERGPWGVIQARWPEAATVPMKIRTLGELPGLFGF